MRSLIFRVYSTGRFCSVRYILFRVFGCCQTLCPSLYVYCAVVVFLYFCLDSFTLFVCKGAHRVTDLAKFPVRIFKDEAPMPLPTVGPLSIFPMSFHFSRALIARCVAFRSFSLCLPWLSQQARPHQRACLVLGVFGCALMALTVVIHLFGAKE